MTLSGEGFKADVRVRLPAATLGADCVSTWKLPELFPDYERLAIVGAMQRQGVPPEQVRVAVTDREGVWHDAEGGRQSGNHIGPMYSRAPDLIVINPWSLTDLTPEEWYVAIAHELGHILRARVEPREVFHFNLFSDPMCARQTWAVTSSRGFLVESTAPTKEEAVRRGRKVAESVGADIEDSFRPHDYRTDEFEPLVWEALQSWVFAWTDGRYHRFVLKLHAAFTEPLPEHLSREERTAMLRANRRFGIISCARRMRIRKEIRRRLARQCGEVSL